MKKLSRNSKRPPSSQRGGPWVVSALLGTGLALASCQAEMNQNVGCNRDSDCPNDLRCDSSGRCVAPPTYTSVTISKIGDGDGTITSSPDGINCGATCTAMFAIGQPLTLTATPNAGAAVAGFSIGCNSNATSCTFTPTVKDEPVQVLVNFSLGTVAPVPAVCNGSGYCWENPRPQGNRLNRVVAVATNDEWAVGDAGTIVHRTSNATTLAVSGVTRNLYGLWASGADLYAVGEGGVILHSSGGTWAADNSGVTTDLYDIAGAGGNVYAVGAGGVILKRGAGGGFWTKETSPTTRDLRGLVGLPSGELYGVGTNATVVRYSAGAWTTTTDAALGTSNLTAIATGATGSPIYLTSSSEIFRFNAGTYSRVFQQGTVDLRGIAVSPTGIVAVGQQGTVALALRSSDGTTWNNETFNAQSALNAVAAGPGEIVAVGEAGAILRSESNPWTPLSSGRTDQIRAIHASDATHGWAVGLNGTLLQWNGTYWAPFGLTGTPPSFFGVFTVSATEAWAVGSGGAVWRWNGSAWNQQASGTSANLRAVWAAAANKVYIVGDGGVALLWNGSAFSQVGAGNAVNLLAVGGSSATDVWAAGDNGTVLRSSGGNFTVVTSGLATTDAVGGLWAGAANNVWFAANSSMYRYDGISITKYNTTATGLRAVSGVGGEVYAVGNAGALVRWNNTSWEIVETGTKRDFYGIFLGAQKQWLGGAFGALLSRPR